MVDSWWPKIRVGSSSRAVSRQPLRVSPDQSSPTAQAHRPSDRSSDARASRAWGHCKFADARRLTRRSSHSRPGPSHRPVARSTGQPCHRRGDAAPAAGARSLKRFGSSVAGRTPISALIDSHHVQEARAEPRPQERRQDAAEVQVRCPGRAAGEPALGGQELPGGVVAGGQGADDGIQERPER